LLRWLAEVDIAALDGEVDDERIDVEADETLPRRVAVVEVERARAGIGDTSASRVDRPMLAPT
jgi:hypothetical protein